MVHEFVKHIPNDLKDGVIYVSIPFKTAIHKCCCGCGSEVVTPISPTDWELIYDGEAVSLYPSIGNWSFKCKSHYWITKNKVEWARKWTDEEIQWGRKKDFLEKKKYYDFPKNCKDVCAFDDNLTKDKISYKNIFWAKLKKIWTK